MMSTPWWCHGIDQQGVCYGIWCRRLERQSESWREDGVRGRLWVKWKRFRIKDWGVVYILITQVNKQAYLCLLIGSFRKRQRVCMESGAQKKKRKEKEITPGCGFTMFHCIHYLSVPYQFPVSAAHTFFTFLLRASRDIYDCNGPQKILNKEPDGWRWIIDTKCLNLSGLNIS